MRGDEIHTELIDLIAAAAPAHHQAYIDTDGDDPEWPLWYAAYLQEPLNHLLGAAYTRSELVYHLVRLEMERAEKAPDRAWAEYYAADFYQRYLNAHHGSADF